MTQLDDPGVEKVVNGFATIAITPEHKRKWDYTVSMMTWTAPGFLHLLYKLLNAQNNADASDYVALMSKDIPIAATDGANIIVNPETYFALSLPHRTFILGHEIMHNMFGDVEMAHRCYEQGYVQMPEGDKLPFDDDTMQIAMDARINALLIESKIGGKPDIGIYDAQVKAGDSVYDVYRKYLKKKQQGDKPGNQPGNKPGNKPGSQPGNRHGNKPNPGGGFDQLLKPGEATGKDPHKAAQDRDPQQWAVETAVAQALEEMRSQGDMPAGMTKVFKQLLEPEISWIDYIETLVKRHVGDGSVDWTMPNPWLGSTASGAEYFVPADTGTGAGWIVVWGDTSGSVFDNATQARNIAELAGLMEQINPARLTLIWCDASIKEEGSVIELTDPDELRHAKPVGGGGTDYKPVLDWIAANNHGEQPDLFIGFTDGYVSFPKEHPFPTIWASSTDFQYPFGQVVRINNIARSQT